LLCPDTRVAIKARLTFAVERWSGSGALFAWDLWNEMHPAHTGNDPGPFAEVIEDLSTHVRSLEMKLYGRAHPQTVSIFGPVLDRDPGIAEPIFRHPSLDFASTHFYEHGTIDAPRDTVAPAVSTGKLTRLALEQIADERPFFDSEHGPIHTFKDHRKTLLDAFDDEYFRHIQWAHFASGGAGGGMRWPNRNPHILTAGMRRAQQGLAGFLPFIDWTRFRRRNLNQELRVCTPGFASFACGDNNQAVVWLLRSDRIGRGGMLDQKAEPVAPRIGIPGLSPGSYQVTAWDTRSGTRRSAWQMCQPAEGPLFLDLPPLVTDLALAVRRFDA
jgi:mannan endo-1,4-beta-mannosidase